MKIGKFAMSIIYDIQCDICGEYRMDIGWSTFSIFTKPTAKILKKEGWSINEKGQQVCPWCNEKRKRESAQKALEGKE